MAEEISGRKIFTLLEVTKSIQKTIAERYKSSYWIKAEMNKLNYYPHSGHCYPDLVEKHDGKIIAQLRANIWNEDYRRINDEFHRVLKEDLKDGIKILFLAQITFRPEYGLALRIIDIDPSFTLGDLEKEKQETIKKLESEGIFKKNKTLKISLLPQRIAVISVQTSKGYADFLEVLGEAGKNYGFRFFHMLFPSLLQGEKAVSAIIGQLNRIR
ncbi:MAG: exodeoxyribonuclease VII large subunit, partial [Bacteroidetes bacterium]|nr:exodeoxyribonuclease VII large subunit [Bacteroidota bacterium]